MLADPQGELILLGDSFDFTAMTPPEKGLSKFAEAMQVPIEPRPPRSVAALCAAEALASIGLGRAQVETFVERTVGTRRILLAHGHHLDHDNATPAKAAR